MVKVYINDKDIYQEFGASMIRGGIEALLTPAANKEYVTTSSRLRNGTQYQTANIKKEQRELTLSFCIEGDTHVAYLNNYEAFLNEINGAFTLRVLAQDIVDGLYYTKFDRTFNLVYTSCSKYGDYGLKKGIFAMKLVEPDPTDRIVGNEVI